jgi:hypothetical protein
VSLQGTFASQKQPFFALTFLIDSLGSFPPLYLLLLFGTGRLTSNGKRWPIPHENVAVRGVGEVTHFQGLQFDRSIIVQHSLQ